MDFAGASQIYERYRRSPVERAVSPEDVMWRSGKDWYFDTGESALRCILSALVLSRLDEVTSVLDLPCGFGRVSRHLRTAFPAAGLSFCDIDPAGVAFCADNFKGRAIRSAPELSEVDLGGCYDVIWIGSLFTHVDKERTERWLRFLCGHLNQDGVLLATFHGAGSRQLHLTHYPMIGDRGWTAVEDGFRRTGFGYSPHPGQDYGISLSRASTIVDIACSIPGTRLLSYTERGWYENQDVAVVALSDRLEDWGDATQKVSRSLAPHPRA